MLRAIVIPIIRLIETTMTHGSRSSIAPTAIMRSLSVEYSNWTPAIRTKVMS
jgi:hypothetical protein